MSERRHVGRERDRRQYGWKFNFKFNRFVSQLRLRCSCTFKTPTPGRAAGAFPRLLAYHDSVQGSRFGRALLGGSRATAFAWRTQPRDACGAPRRAFLTATARMAAVQQPLEHDKMLAAARDYVEQSNRGEVGACLAMFAQDAVYGSTTVGGHQGIEAISTMMTGFFGKFPSVHWQVEKYAISQVRERGR